jgi:DHA1 family inner membrane transport protein
MFFANRDINRLAAHTTLVSLAIGLAGTFLVVFLLSSGLPLTQVFLVFAAILALRFALRPLVIVVASAIGLRRTLIIGTALNALPFLAVIYVHGVGPALLVFGVVAAVSEAFYWTCYHAFFGSLGDTGHRGQQIGAREALGALANVIGPAAGGLMLAHVGPWAAFGTACAAQLAAVFPLLTVPEPKIVKPAPAGTLAAATIGIQLFFVDGWIQSGAAIAWSVVTFETLGARFDKFGILLAVAALAGALGGMVLGRFMDMGHARRSVWLNAAVLTVGFVLKAMVGGHELAVIAVAIGTTIFSGLYMPYWMTAVYNAGKAAPCTFRFHFAAEGGWDAGGVAVCLVSAGICAAGWPLWVMVLTALPAVAVQALLLAPRYRAHDSARALGSR